MNILNCVGHMVFATTTQVCPGSEKAVRDNIVNEWAWLYSNKILFAKIVFGFSPWAVVC